MRGVITGREILMHPVLIVSLFGARCYLRCLCALLEGRPSTFLEIAFSSPGAALPPSTRP